MKVKIDYDNNGEKDEEGEYFKVPIENEQGTLHMFSRVNNIKLFITKLKSLIKKNFLIISLFTIILVIIVLFIVAKSAYGNSIDNSNDPFNLNKNENNNDNKENTYNINESKKREDLFYISQKKNKINMESIYSPQLINPQNIKLIQNLEISLDLEYENFIHLKIKDSSQKRWEVPEIDVLNKNYLKNRQNNKHSLTKNKPNIKTNLFNIEVLTKKNLNDTQDNNIISNNNNNNNNNNNVDEAFSFKLTNKENNEFYSFTTSNNFLYSDNYIHFQSRLTSDNIYGFGERTHDFKLDNNLYTIWPHDCGGTKYDFGEGAKNQYSHQPIALHKTKYTYLWLGFVFLNTNAQDVIIDTVKEKDNSNTYLTHKTIGGIIDYYIIVSSFPEEVIKKIQFLLGIPPLPPYWSLGYHQSRYGYKDFSQFKNVYEQYKNNNIPIDTMWIDIDSLKNFEIFTIDRKFKDLPNYVKNNIHKDGGKFVPIVDLGISYENMRNPYVKLGNSLDIFIKSNYTKKPLIGKVWPGKTVFPDFLNPKIEKFWFKGLEDYHNLIKYDGIWLDMNEPANLLENAYCIGEVADIGECTEDKNKYHREKLSYFPGGKKDISMKSINENAIVYGNNVIYDVKPLIAYYQTKYTFEFLDTKLKIRPFVLSRSTSIGSGKYTSHWLGDNFSNYSNLKNSISGIFNFNIFGIPFTGSDICGFMDNANRELCIRWYNLGVFYPFSRNHNFFNVRDQYPWSFGNSNQYDTIEIIKKDINYRYSLLRYMYSQFFLISLNEKGSFFKPLMFEYPEEKTSYEDIESKIMFGEAFLICAFYERSEDNKNFVLPNDNFNEYPTGKSIMNYNQKNKKIELSGQLDKIYIFLRGGFIVPSQNTFNKFILNSLKLRDEKINLIINPDRNKRSIGELFYDNDDNNTIEKNLYYRVDFLFDGDNLFINVNKNNIDKYIYNDHILGTIEIWRANELFKINNNINNNNPNSFKVQIFYKNKEKNVENIEGIYEKENNKLIVEISKDNKKISLFDIRKISFNDN